MKGRIDTKADFIGKICGVVMEKGSQANNTGTSFKMNILPGLKRLSSYIVIKSLPPHFKQVFPRKQVSQQYEVCRKQSAH